MVSVWISPKSGSRPGAAQRDHTPGYQHACSANDGGAVLNIRARSQWRAIRLRADWLGAGFGVPPPPIPLSLPQPHARPSAILGDELDAGGFESRAYGLRGRRDRVGAGTFQSPHGRFADARLTGEFFNRPIESGARHAALSGRYHATGIRSHDRWRKRSVNATCSTRSLSGHASDWPRCFEHFGKPDPKQGVEQSPD